MKRLPRRYAPFIYGMIQAAITSAVATAIATHQLAHFDLEFALYWLGCWALSLATMLPVVILISPVIQRAVISLTEGNTPSEKV